MERINYPSQLPLFPGRLQNDSQSTVNQTVKDILDRVKHEGDTALRAFSLQFDQLETGELIVPQTAIAESANQLTDALKAAINQAASNILKFHSSQLSDVEKVETMPGVWCWRKSVGIEKVGIYIPGGTAPLFSTVLMLAIPAKLAGCKQVVLCTPAQKDGNVHPAVLYAALVSGITLVVKTGGAQSIAALAYGTESVPKVHKIFGPGNQYVTAAKQMVQQEGVAIDMPAGPSEVCVMADETAVPAFVAADLLSQAEHGADSEVLLLCANEELLVSVEKELDLQMARLPRKTFAEKSLQRSKAVIFNSVEEALEIVNEYAPEHLIISMKNAEEVSEKVISAGSIFLGNYSPESVGDYASGTNHTLPTHGFAAMYSGVSVDSFVKKITVQHLTQQGLKNIAPTVVEMAMAEGLEAHAHAVSSRLTFMEAMEG